MSHFSVAAGLKPINGFHENKLIVSRNFSKQTSLEYLFFEIGVVFFVPENIIHMQKVCANTFSWYIVRQYYESGLFRPWVVSAWSFRPGSFRPFFGGGSFRPW